MFLVQGQAEYSVFLVKEILQEKKKNLHKTHIFRSASQKIPREIIFKKLLLAESNNLKTAKVVNYLGVFPIVHLNTHTWIYIKQNKKKNTKAIKNIFSGSYFA